MSGYIGSTPVPQATQHRESFTCTEGQTTFNTAGYTAQFVDVYLNGSHLSPADFTATNGSDVVLGVAASADDVCDIISYTPFEVAAQTFTGTTTMTDVVAATLDISGNIDIDGTTNLDVVDIDGAVNMATTALVTGVLTTTAATVFNGGFASNGNSTVGGTFSVTGANAATVSIIAPTDNATLELRGGNSDSAVEEANIVFYQNNAAKWQLGNATDNAFKLYNYATSSYAMIVDATGAVTKPLQPAFLVQPASQQDNLAGTGATVNFATERFDQNSDWNVQTFTAPVTGKYQFNVNLLLLGVDADINYYSVKLTTSNRTYISEFDPDFGQDPAKWIVSFGILADMDASDTATVVVSFSPDDATSTVDIATESYFSGFLAC